MRISRVTSLLCALGLLGQSSVGYAEQYFAEPYSGKKVESYQITLPVARAENRSFAIPADCPQAMQALAEGAAQWGSRVEQSVWWKVGRDCEYDAFLHRFTLQPPEDYVTGYDFMNAYLRDLPMSVRCPATEDAASLPGCEPFPPGVPDLSGFLPFVDRGSDAPWVDIGPCQLQHGMFRGRMVRDQTGIHCEADRRAPGFRVMSVDYADVNGDGFLDVVLRLIPLGPGHSRAPVLLPLTRKEPGGAFSVPSGVSLPLSAERRY